MKKTRLNTAAILALLTAGAFAPTAARADACPPSVAAFDTWTWLQGDASGDDWMTSVVCQSDAFREAAKNLVVSHMGLDHNWDYWSTIVPSANDCNPDNWGARTVNGGYAVEYVGINRDNDTFAHFATPTGILPDGTAVTHWLSQYVDFYISEEGYNWKCLASGDLAGPGDGFTYASNPSDNSACSLYYPWFWNKTVTDRASTIVHEATHEFAPHIANSACTNGASCDTAFMTPNAQSFQIVFDAQSVDAYQREDNSRELKVVGYGNGVCGYLPLLPDQERFSQVQVMQSKLQNCFQTVPTQANWPTAAFVDSVAGTIYDVAAEPGGNAGQAYRIDVTNNAMWPCDKVCNPEDFTFHANGVGGPRACNENYQAGNAQVNADNRKHCGDLNDLVAAGVTPAERTALLNQANNSMHGCVPGISSEYLAQVCAQASAGANTVDDVENNWSIPESMGYAYEAEDAIRACQATFCQHQPLGSWNEDAYSACYEWDDPAGCMQLACGDLPTIETQKGHNSFEYLNALVCRAEQLGRNVESLEGAGGICDRVFDECYIRENFLPLFLAQMDGGACWADAIMNAADPLQRERRLLVGNMSVERYVASDRGVRLLSTACLMEEQQCEALQAALAAIAAKIAGIKATTRPGWKHPPLPDPWENLAGRFDREVIQEMAEVGVELGRPGAAPVALSRNVRLMAAAKRPEARLAIAEFIGQDVYLAAGGEQLAQGVFAPERIAQYTGERAAHDTGGVDIVGFEDEVAALKTLNTRIGSAEWQDLMSRAGQLDGATYYNHLVAMLQAQDGQALLAAHDALQADLQALGR